MIKFAILALYAVLVAAREAEVSAENGFPEFVIDMDKEPEERFQEVARHFRTPVIKLVKTIVSELPEFVGEVFKYTSWIWKYTNNQKYREIKGIVEALDSTEVPLEYGLLVNSLYELQAWCTSIIAKMDNGTIIHSRNLDFPDSSQFRNITHIAKFVKGGKEQFETVMFAGNVGVYTAIKKGAYSISQNQRQFMAKEIGLVENLAMLFSGFDEISWLIRSCLETCETYECARQHLETGKINALGYIILAGTKDDEGVVITRNRLNTAHVDSLNSTIGKWYVVQTNNDHWEDHGCYNRCAAAHAHMTQVGQQNIDVNTIRSGVLEVFPNLNGDTIYNTDFIPSQGYFNTIPLTFSQEKWDEQVNFEEQDQFQIPEKSDQIQSFNFKENLKMTVPASYYDIFIDMLQAKVGQLYGFYDLGFKF